jgi:hypothetical protein
MGVGLCHTEQYQQILSNLKEEIRRYIIEKKGQ